jgi:hypothetical protein
MSRRRIFRDQFLKTLPLLAKRVTLYVSDNDKALRTSTGLRDGIPRAGLLEGGLMDVHRARVRGCRRHAPAGGLPRPQLLLEPTGRCYADIYCLLEGSAASGRPLLMAAKVNWIFKPASMLQTLKAAACQKSEDSSGRASCHRSYSGLIHRRLRVRADGG